MKDRYTIIRSVTCEDCATGYGETGPLVLVRDQLPDLDGEENLTTICRECLDKRLKYHNDTFRLEDDE